MIETTHQKEHVSVLLDAVWQGTAGKFDAQIGKINSEGCFISSAGQEIMGETIDFKVRLPSGLWVILQGEVVYQEYPIGFEVLFNNQTKENRGLLTEIIVAYGGEETQQILKQLPEETKTATPIPRTDRRRILIADDDAMILRMLRAIIETEGYQVITAADGREAFEILQQDADFSAVIFDMIMPHMRGTDLINYMKTEDQLSSIPIGMITGDSKTWGDTVALGASVFLPKPFTPPQIQMMLRMLVKTGSH
jgi:CheY-like chemotaxis protein